MATVADGIWNNVATGNSWSVAWLGSIAYTLQIFFDFSGYSDMAIGLGRMFGFHFNENFNLPYISKSISEFWRRWHISLSSWFRDYVYIPLGGNRKHVYFNLSIVFLLTGIWHGSSWHFVIWGLWNLMFILVERIIKTKKKSDSNKKLIFKSIISSIYTLFVVNIGWVLFRAPHMKDAIQFVGTMFGIIKPENPGFTLMWYLDKWNIVIMILGILFSTTFPSGICAIIKKYIPTRAVTIIKYICLLMLLYLSMIRIVSGNYNPFIYFQF